MSSDIEHFYVQRSEPLVPLLPDGAAWEQIGEEISTEGDGWVLLLYEPEPVDAAEIPEDLRTALPGLAFRVAASIEPIAPPEDAWDLLDTVLDAVGAALGGATYDLRSGHAIAWVNGSRTRI
jgi:hypothetical protein